MFLQSIIQSSQYPAFLENAITTFRRVLAEGQPIFIAEHTGQQLRKLLLEIIQRLPINDYLRPYFKTIISLMFQLIEVMLSRALIPRFTNNLYHEG